MGNGRIPSGAGSAERVDSFDDRVDPADQDGARGDGPAVAFEPAVKVIASASACGSALMSEPYVHAAIRKTNLG